MKIAKHPASERASCWFHLAFAAIGVAHIVGGIAMTWFHGVGAKRHWDDRHEDVRRYF